MDNRIVCSAYRLRGLAIQAGVVQSAEYTSTHTTFTCKCVGCRIGHICTGLPLTRCRRVTLLRQSAPYSYLTDILLPETSGATPDVQVYTDIDNTWAGQFDNGNVQIGWGYTNIDNTSIFVLNPGGAATYSEYNDTAQWGSPVYCARGDPYKLTATVGGINEVRAAFSQNGTLDGPWQWQSGSVVAYSQNLGKLQAGKASNVFFAIGYWREPAINYLGNPRAQYFKSTCADPQCGCIHIMDDYGDADAEATVL